MQATTNLTKQLFANELRRRCVEHYSKLPSNEQLARDLYSTSKYTLKVSRETVRKWLKGETFPDLDHLLHLIDWLGLNMASVFTDVSAVDCGLSRNSHLKYLDICSINQISVQQIDSLVGLLNSLKDTGFVRDRKFE